MTGNAFKIIQYLYNQPKDKLFVIKEYKKKRSLNQNSYAWELITKISNKMRLSKEEVYFQMLKDYGQSEDILLSANANIIGYAKYYELIGGEVIYYGKPHKRIYEYALEVSGITDKSKVIAIGDNVDTDIKGAKDFWIDSYLVDTGLKNPK